MNKLYDTGIFYYNSGIYRHCVKNDIRIIIDWNPVPPQKYHAILSEEEALVYTLKFGEKPRPINVEDIKQKNEV